MFRVVLLFAYLAACSGHAVLPLVHHEPIVHSHVVHASPYLHGYPGYGHHGYAVKPLVHHLYKRSPHLVGHLAPVGHVAPVAVAPVAVSHQSRVDVRSSPAVVPVLPVVKPVVAPLLHPAPLVHKSYVAPYGAGYYGGVGGYGGFGHYGAAYPHLGY